MPNFTTSTIRQLSDGNPDGTSLGQSASDKISVYNATPLAQQVKPTALGTTAATSTTPYGFGSAAQADAVITAVNDVISKLALFGVWA